MAAAVGEDSTANALKTRSSATDTHQNARRCASTNTSAWRRWYRFWVALMAKCPYTWVKGLFGGASTPAEPGQPAKHLMVRVVRDGEERVRVALPARSAKWLIELIPPDVADKIRAEAIPLDEMLLDLNAQETFLARPIFSLAEPHRSVDVWLE